MNKLLFYIFSLILIVSCASDNIEDSITTDNNLPAAGQDNNKEEDKWIWPEGVSASVPDLETIGDEDITRALTYDVTNKIMRFSWKISTGTNKDGDCIGVFPIWDEHNNVTTETDQMQYVLTNEPTVESASYVLGKFEIYDPHVSPIKGNTPYVSYYPFKTPGIGEPDYRYNAIPVTYLGQTQDRNINVKAYYKRTSDAEQMNIYKATEPAASAHLTDYDYMVSEAVSTETSDIHFRYTRLGATVRFFLRAPEPIFYDSIQLVNTEKKFMTKGLMNVKEKTLTATESKHVVKLALNKTNFDFTSDVDNNNYRDVSDSEKTGYIIAYMMFAPIELKSATGCTLYLCGHSEDGEGNVTQKYYFRSIGTLTKLDILQNKIQQWSNNMEPDEPITFNAISVEEWKEGTTFSNGDDGKGTEGW